MYITVGWLSMAYKALQAVYKLAIHLCKILLQALNPHRLCPPSSNGYQVELNLVLCE